MMLMPTPTITTLPSLPHLHRKMRDSRRVCKLPERRLEKLVVLVALDIARAARPNRLEVILRAPVPGRRKGKKGKEEKRMVPEQTCILQAQRRRSKARPLHRMRLSAKTAFHFSLSLSLSLTHHSFSHCVFITSPGSLSFSSSLSSPASFFCSYSALALAVASVSTTWVETSLPRRGGRRAKPNHTHKKNRKKQRPDGCDESAIAEMLGFLLRSILGLFQSSAPPGPLAAWHSVFPCASTRPAGPPIQQEKGERRQSDYCNFKQHHRANQSTGLARSAALSSPRRKKARGS